MKRLSSRRIGTSRHLLVEGRRGGIVRNEKLALAILVPDRYGAKDPVRTNAGRRDAIDRFGDGVEAVNAHLVAEKPPADGLAASTPTSTTTKGSCSRPLPMTQRVKGTWSW